MPGTRPTCPKCAGSMEPGYVPDVAYGQTLQSAWAPGEPKVRRFVGGIKWRQADNTPIVTFRCQRCGYLESYARPA